MWIRKRKELNGEREGKNGLEFWKKDVLSHSLYGFCILLSTKFSTQIDNITTSISMNESWWGGLVWDLKLLWGRLDVEDNPLEILKQAKFNF